MVRIVFYQLVPHYGGAPRCTVEFAARLKAHADVVIVDPLGTCPEYRQAAEAAGIPYHVVWPQTSRHDIGGWGNPLARSLRLAQHVPHMLRLASKTAQLMDRLQPSVISTDNFKSAMVLAMHRRLRRIPACYFLHSWYRPPQMSRMGRWLCRHHATGILGVSYATMQACICAGVQWDKLQALYNPIDVDEMERRAALPLEAPLPQTDRPVRLLLPAGLMQSKGQHIAVQALRHILDRGHDAVLWLAGDHQAVGPNRTYVENVRRMARDLRVQDRVEFLGLRHDIPQVMKAATVLVLPTSLEGHPRVIVEGMALKRPFIATPAGGCLDMLSPGLTGYLMRFDNPQDLADCVDRVVADPCATRRIVDTAYDWVRREFTPAEHTRKLLAFYEAVARRRT
jgi:glycosyltransferase involved in cell wall biosynthesis